MIPLVTAEQMREIDRHLIEELGVPGIALMETAGVAAAQVVRKELERRGGRRVCILAGRGNNGGDGFVMARHLANVATVEVFLLGPKDRLHGEARTNLGICERLGLVVTEVLDEAALGTVKASLERADVVVDALLGTGLQSAPREPIASAIRLVNAEGKPVVAVDVPSGLESDTGRVHENCCVRAMHTVTFGAAKIGLMVYPGLSYAGDVTIADLGVPTALLNAPEINVGLTTAADVQAIWPRRAPDAHKGSCGHALIFAGSLGMTGAAMLSARAALRVGAGLVTVAGPQSLNPILETALPEILTVPLPETDRASIAATALPHVASLLEWATAVAVGPGLSQHSQTGEFVQGLIATCSRPLVVDADGLNLLAAGERPCFGADRPTILTPHPGEMARLLKRSVREVQADRLAAAREAAATFQALVVLKGARTVIAAPEGRVAINPTGNPGLASGGTGDVLTGIIVGLLAQGVAPWGAAVAGTYLHGLAADLAVDQGCEAALIAGDVVDQLPAAIRGLLGEPWAGRPRPSCPLQEGA